MREEVRSENRLGVSNKAEIPERQSVVGVELGLKLHQEEGKDRRSQKQHNDRLPSLCSNQIDGNGGGNGGDNRRPTFSELDTLYLSSSGVCDVSTPADSTVAGNGVSAPSAVRSCLLQPFDMSCLPAAYPFFKSPGGGGGGMATAPATTLGFFPFTAAQWKELQRQAMIYKYMVASLPVPPDLLFPISANISDHPSTSASPWGKMGMFDLRWESQSKDAEPGRCKRTDGKKWRCSRDVAPNQKYCERHLNRGRPRSRKPVEVRADFSINHHPDKISSAKKTRLGDDAQISSINLAGLRTDINGSISDKAQFHRNHESKASSFEHMVSAQGASVAATAQQWQQLGLRNMGLAADASVFGPHFQDEPLNSNSLVNFNSKQPSSDDQNCCLFANSATPKGFIDALSNHDDGAGNKSSVPSNENVYPSSLALSMAGRNPIDEEMCQIQMGLGDIYSDCSSGDGLKHQVPDWLGPPSWVPSNPGGPLAEVLQPRSATAVTNLATHPSCPDARNGDLVTPPATAVSSPSGVLQRSLASFSDSSGNNSPLYHTTKAKPEIPFQRLS